VSDIVMVFLFFLRWKTVVKMVFELCGCVYKRFPESWADNCCEIGYLWLSVISSIFIV